MTPLQEMIWKSIRDYFEANATKDARKRCKTLPQKRSYLVKELGLEITEEPLQQICRGNHRHMDPWTVSIIYFNLCGTGLVRCSQQERLYRHRFSSSWDFVEAGLCSRNKFT